MFSWLSKKIRNLERGIGEVAGYLQKLSILLDILEFVLPQYELLFF